MAFPSPQQLPYFTHMLKIAYDKCYAHPLPVGHRFPMEKYELIPQQLRHEGLVSDINFFAPQPIDEADILLTHTPEYWQKLKHRSLDAKEIRRTGFPLSEALVTREMIICRGTVDCAECALKYGAAFNVAGGTHHAGPDWGEGFCLMNDVAVAANYLLNRQLASRIIIIDLDVHQGNGTAKIFEQEPRVFTFSMHGQNNFPFHKEKSDLDIPLPDGIADNDYLYLLNLHLPQILQQFKPDFAFYISGVDVLESDKLGKLHLSEKGCMQRDDTVFKLLKNAGIPVVTTMGGGYSTKVSVIVNAHVNTFKSALRIFF